MKHRSFTLDETSGLHRQRQASFYTIAYNGRKATSEIVDVTPCRSRRETGQGVPNRCGCRDDRASGCEIGLFGLDRESSDHRINKQFVASAILSAARLLWGKATVVNSRSVPCQLVAELQL